MTTRTHYAVLGLHETATAEAIREAYRRLAREFHPDRTQGSAAGGDRMPAINEAYRVLSDPGRRAVYDATLRGSTSRPGTVHGGSASPPGVSTTDDGPGDEAMREWRYKHPEGPPRIPWRVLSVCTVIAVIGIVVLAQFSEPGEPAGPDGILRAGDCVETIDNGFVREVGCVGDEDLVVREFVAFDRPCSNGLTAYQDRQGMGRACVAPRVPTGT